MTRPIDMDEHFVEGNDVRPIGVVTDPTPLTTFDPDHPYYMAEYDLSERG